MRVADKSRADYFRERRKQKETKAFYVEVDKKKLENLEGKLSKERKTKKEWLNEKIDEELKE
ncbi:MAG: hypothetical protein HFG79_14795 [Lachnospiraceae bacterium]|jgi:hypothetical protein|nr:hypothetical protein [Lachnospiraceae bacterium]